MSSSEKESLGRGNAVSALLEPALLMRLNQLKVQSHKRLLGAIVGRHRSPSHGASIEFAEHKEYTPGDEIRHLDWKAYGKFDKYYVKRYEDETNLRTFVIVDASGSMGYGEPTSKLLHASKLAAALAFVLLKQQDSVGLITVSDKVDHYIPPRATSSHLEDVCRTLVGLRPAGATLLAQGLQQVTEHARRRSTVFVLSDLFDQSSGLEKGLTQMAQRHEVTLLHVLDRDELEFPFDQLTVFRSMEDDAEVLAEPLVIRDTYLRELLRFRESMRRLALKNGMGYHLANTADTVDSIVVRCLTSRTVSKRSEADAV